jgi:excisionase family DNA binding protein
VLPIFRGDVYAMQSVIEVIASSKRALTAADLASILSVTPDAIYALARRGILPSFRIGSAVRFDPKAVAQYLQGK